MLGQTHRASREREVAEEMKKESLGRRKNTRQRCHRSPGRDVCEEAVTTEGAEEGARWPRVHQNFTTQRPRCPKKEHFQGMEGWNTRQSKLKCK